MKLLNKNRMRFWTPILWGLEAVQRETEPESYKWNSVWTHLDWSSGSCLSECSCDGNIKVHSSCEWTFVTGVEVRSIQQVELAQYRCFSFNRTETNERRKRFPVISQNIHVGKPMKLLRIMKHFTWNSIATVRRVALSVATLLDAGNKA